MPAFAFLPLMALLARPQAARPAPEPERAEEAAAAKAKPAEGRKEDKKDEREEPPVVTHHELRAGGRILRYTATTGLMPLKSETGDLEAHVFYVAYTLDRGGAPVEKRPLMFSFNGGPSFRRNSWAWRETSRPSASSSASISRGASAGRRLSFSWARATARRVPPAFRDPSSTRASPSTASCSSRRS